MSRLSARRPSSAGFRPIGRPILGYMLLFVASACSSRGEHDVTAGTAWTAPSVAEIEALLAQRMEHNGVGVVVGVIDQNGRQIVAHGRSGAPDDRPLDGATVFQLGSVTKPITSLLLADMVTRGEVDLDDAASVYLPDGVSLPRRGRPITLRDLSTHMSGLPSMPTNFDINARPDPIEGYTVDDLWAFLSAYELEREPGTEYEYSNLGVSLMGRLLARSRDTDYEALVTERVLAPLGMSSTSITLSEDQVARLARGHGPYLTPVTTWEMATLQASGSLRSTAEDMLNLIGAYLGYSETPLRAAMDLQLVAGGPRNGQEQALGWGLQENGTVRHSGGKAGYRSGVAFNPKTGIGAVVLANARTDDPPIALADYLVNGTPLSPATRAPLKAAVPLSHAALDAFVGRYRLLSGGRIDVVRMADRLVMRYEDGSIWEFEPSGPTDFYIVSGNDDVTFQVDVGGDVTGLIRFGDGKPEGGGEVAARDEG